MSEFCVGDLVSLSDNETDLCGIVTEIMNSGSVLVKWGNNAFPSPEHPINLSHYSAPLDEESDDSDVIFALKEAINNARTYGWNVSCTVSKEEYL